MDYVQTGRFPMFAGFTASTPVLPQLYWDVYSAEQRWKCICQWLKKLTEYADYINSNVNDYVNDIEALQTALKELQSQVEELAKTLEQEILEQIEKQLEEIDAKINENAEKAQTYTDEQIKALDEKSSELYSTKAQLEAETIRVNVLVATLQTALDALSKRVDELEYTNRQWDVVAASMVETIDAQRDMFNYVTVHAESCEGIANDTGALTVETLADSGLNVRGFATANHYYYHDVSELPVYYKYKD